MKLKPLIFQRKDAGPKEEKQLVHMSIISALAHSSISICGKPAVCQALEGSSAQHVPALMEPIVFDQIIFHQTKRKCCQVTRFFEGKAHGTVRI